LIAALLGEYATQIEGLAFTITTHEGKFYAAATGSAPEENKPYKLTDELVGFRIKRDRTDFVRAKDAITHMVLKSPGLTLEAMKKSDPKGDIL
jgi:hypothetical protein